jgi:hypothetical protein
MVRTGSAVHLAMESRYHQQRMRTHHRREQVAVVSVERLRQETGLKVNLDLTVLTCAPCAFSESSLETTLSRHLGIAHPLHLQQHGDEHLQVMTQQPLDHSFRAFLRRQAQRSLLQRRFVCVPAHGEFYSVLVPLYSQARYWLEHGHSRSNGGL